MVSLTPAAGQGGAAPPGWVPGWLAGSLAWQRQWQGRYDDATEAWFRHAWRRTGSAAALLHYLQFRRERGRLPTPVQLDALLQGLPGLSDQLLLPALEALIEADALPQAPLDTLAPRVLRWAGQSPPLAARLAAAGAALPAAARRLAQWNDAQPALRQAFAAWLLDTCGDIAVVGNAGSLRGAGLGRDIDRHPLVVRFNRYSSQATGPEDLGRRLDLWVCAPKFLPEAATMGTGGARWLVLSGPDVRYRRAGAPLDCAALQRLIEAGVGVLTIPLDAWAGLVDRLGAPPSAGVMLLAWARTLLGGWERLAIAGFDSAQGSRRAYHHAGRRLRPGRRHAWRAERALLDEWLGEGLRVLTAQC